MTDPGTLTRQYLDKTRVMQLATAVGDKPWVCTVHFYADEEMNLYWMSKKDRKHSRQIEQNPGAAAAVMIHENNPDEDYVIGISVAGTAKLLIDIPETAIRGYINKHGKQLELIDDVKDYIGNEGFYCLEPSQIVLFDTKNFPNDPRQVLTVI